ncbi:MAG: Hpt domain-containing protein [Rhodocyclaceae bacterium]|nr:Hpt domain-containing protein [Rhodocyclaceae bacterium]
MSLELDTGPLSWVRDEIDLALERTAQALDDGSRLGEARGNLHQAGGALAIVGLAGISEFSVAIEQLLAAAAAGEIEWGAAQTEAARTAVAALRGYLDELMAGAANQPLRLLPAYRQLAAVRGAAEPAASELFFPDLSQRPPRRESEPAPLPPEALAARLKAARLGFERGLLKWLKDDASGLREMRNAVAIIEQTQDTPAARAFWWVSLALFDVLPRIDRRAAATTAELRRLCGRIDAQIRKLLDGSAVVAERLMRDALYWVAATSGGGEHAEVVRAAYRLGELIPAQGLDVEQERQRQSRLHRFGEEVFASSTAWDRFCAGAAAALPEFHEHAARLASLAEPLARVDLTRLTAAIANAANLLRKNPLIHGEALAEEMTAALLLCEGAADEMARPGGATESGFAEQVDRVTSRLARLLRGESLAGEAPPRLDAVARRAREKRLLAQVGKQIQIRLAQVEQTLDRYFRNPADGSGLAALAAPLKQVEGALALLDENRAAALLADCAAQIAGFAAGAADSTRFERVARQLSALGAFIEQLPRGGGDLAALLGESALPAAEFQPSVERELAQATDATRTLVLNLRQMQSDGALREATRASIRQNLETLRDDAQLVADDGLQQRAAAALAALEQSDASLEAAVDALAPSPAPAAAPSSATLALAAASEPARDEELLAIFLEEAEHEMAALDRLLPALDAQPADRETLAAIRRSFHTLKGSGRMVGLGELGEAAWAMEQLLNQALAQEGAVDAALRAALGEARALFGRWVDNLAAHTPTPAAADFVVRCQALLRREAPPPAAPSAPSAAATVRIGSVTLTPALYAMFLEEARSHLAVLERGSLREAMHAARTLASTAATVNFAPVAALAEQLQAALARFDAAAVAPDAVTAPALAEAVATLRVMVEAIAGGQPPAAAEELLDALTSLAPVPPVGDAGVDPQLLPIFLEESVDLTAALSAALRAWRAQPTNAEARQAVQRLLHTLKGSARMAGALRLGELIHDLESRVTELHEVTSAALDETEAGIDRVVGLIDALAAAPAPLVAAHGPETPTNGPPAAAGEAASIQLRVPAERVDQLINDAGEIAIARSRVEAELRSIKGALSDLTDNVSRLRGQLREIEIQSDSRIASRHVATEETRADFDPLEMDRYTRFQELTRIMAESVNDVSTVQHALLRNLEHAQTALAAQGRLNRELSQGLLRVRMVPFDSIAERLQRTVRQSARDLGKPAQLTIGNGQTELDRAVLERLVGPIEHLLRNAVAHGIEDAATRRGAGKPEAGQIAIELLQRSGEVSLELRDDGAGLDLDRIRQCAVAAGLLKAGEEADTQRLTQFIFLSGFTTANALSAVAGRGVGMDVVRNEIMALGGRVEVHTEPGRGSAFTLTLPASMAIGQALLVQAGNAHYAIPSAMVEQAMELAADEIDALRAEGAYRWMNRRYPWHALNRLLGREPAASAEPRRHWLLLVRGGAHHLALEVDAMLGNQEVVMKPVGPQLARVPGIAGATVLGDGEIVLILNPAALAESAETAAPSPAAAATAAAMPPTVMVVDDSLTVRKITGRLLERAGYRVLTAKDGIDALEKLAETLPEVILADIEMPRMDGFELVRNLRADPRWQTLPVIMITSRTADKHRGVAEQLGVRHFLGKPYDEAQLLELVAGYVGETGAG